jgi:ATP-dependent DNA helicase RecG
MERLRVIENTLDGFIIAEEDLKFRGEGDLFGVHQSGSSSGKRLANFIQHQDIFLSVVNEINTIFESRPDLIIPDLEMLAKDQKILDTI